MADLLLAFAFFFAACFVLFSMMIVRDLSKRGVRTHFVLLRLYLIKYIQQYRKITQEETGQMGPLYYPCIGSINLALICAALGLLLK